jgi:hypothetical protein
MIALSFIRGHPFDLSIILNWNKIFTSSNTTILYFISLNSGHLNSGWPLFKLIKYKIVVFDEVYILFQFNIMIALSHITG